tara:strand:- start:25 stop:753 length:729 start_codon:yes stop_codon:yes gene_type:complete
MRNPKWTRDELILTLSFYHQYFPQIPEKNSKEISELSDTLRKIQIILENDINSNYRNTNGVYMKLMNFHHLNPEYPGKGLESVSQLDREIFQYYEERKDKLFLTSKTIKEIVNSSEFKQELQNTLDVDEDYEGQEGKILTRIHKYRERDPKIIQKKKDKVLKDTGKLICDGCNFDFNKIYGSRGEGFIECHHKKPVSEIKKGEKTKLKDLIVLCSNCHRMIHRKKPWLTLSELKELVEKNQN